jgi:hypothetical protein
MSEGVLAFGGHSWSFLKIEELCRYRRTLLFFRLAMIFYDFGLLEEPLYNDDLYSFM